MYTTNQTLTSNPAPKKCCGIRVGTSEQSMNVKAAEATGEYLSTYSNDDTGMGNGSISIPLVAQEEPLNEESATSRLPKLL